MSLFNETRSRLRWLLSLSITICRLSPRQLIATVSIFIVGQLSLVVAMLLPLKAILLAATDGVPWYLSGLVNTETKDSFIVVLVIGALLAYGINLLGERLIAGQLRSGTSRIFDRSRKLALFPNERTVIRTHYLRFSRVFANGFLFALMTAVGLLISPLLFVMMLGLIISEYCITHVILSRKSVAAHELIKAFRDDRGRLLGVLTNLNFLTGFVVLFIQFLASHERNAILAIVTFLLLRQMTNRLRLSIQDFIALSDDQQRINALIHSHIRYVPPVKNHQESFLSAMRPAQRNKWIPDVLAAVCKSSISGTIESRWNDTSSLEISALDVRILSPSADSTCSSNDSRFEFFLRCFSGPQRHIAEHEARLFESSNPPSLAPRYLGRTTVSDFTVLVFEGLPFEQPSPESFRAAHRTLVSTCEQTPIESALLDQYQRTHPTLPQRLTARLLNRLHTAAGSKVEKKAVGALQKALPDITTSLAELPSVLDNPDFTHRFSRVDDEGQILVWAWHRWRIDVLTARSLDGEDGKAIPLEPISMIDTTALLGMNGLRILASHVSGLETDLKRGLFISALRRAEEINELWAKMRTTTNKANGSDTRQDATNAYL